jgi:predicted porin
MRYVIALVAAMLPAAGVAQDKVPGDAKPRVEVTGCVKGSTLTETNLAASGGAQDENPARRWRLRGSKTLMKQLKEFNGKELTIVGTTNEAKSGLLIGQTKVGKARVYVGSNVGKTTPDPLPELPTIDIESFDATGERCR